jgi:NADPH2:quinone reductase
MSGVAFAANIVGSRGACYRGSISTYATDVDTPSIPFWPLLFKNIRIFFVGSDDFPAEAKLADATALNHALVSGWQGFEIAERSRSRRSRPHTSAWSLQHDADAWWVTP